MPSGTNGNTLFIYLTTGEILHAMPDRGFGYNAAKGDWSPDLSRYDPEVRDLYHK